MFAQQQCVSLNVGSSVEVKVKAVGSNFILGSAQVDISSDVALGAITTPLPNYFAQITNLGNNNYRVTLVALLPSVNISTSSETIMMNVAFASTPIVTKGTTIVAQFLNGSQLPISENCTVLPVTLTTFDANKIGRTTELTWKTATERNSSHFAVERSTNGSDFTEIGIVRAANAATGKSYFFVDETPASGKNTYRLRSVDFDGKTMLSKSHTLTFVGIKKTALFPNPVASDVTVEVSSEKGIGEVSFDVVNITGSILYNRKVIATDEFTRTTLPTESLPAGTYFVKITNGSNVWQHKFIKQ